LAKQEKRGVGGIIRTDNWALGTQTRLNSKRFESSPATPEAPKLFQQEGIMPSAGLANRTAPPIALVTESMDSLGMGTLRAKTPSLLFLVLDRVFAK